MTSTSPNNAQAPPKRKQSSVSLTNGGRAVKRRASKACHCCRSRKVRCDVVESGIPCTNCRLDEVECTVSDSKRRKKSINDGEFPNPSPVSSIDEADEPQLYPYFDELDSVTGLGTSFDGLSVPSNSLEFELSHHVPHMIYQTQGHRLSNEERERRVSSISQLSVNHPPTPSTMAQSVQYSPYLPGLRKPTLPRYVRALPDRITSEDIDYLERKGALTIPETGLRNELLRSYVQFVHPFMPVLDLQEFLSSVEQNDAKDPVSLLLFQAVMFAGTAFVDMRFLHAQGYTSRKAARKAFFQRVRLLYDFDAEIDRISLVQSLLLMTYWYETPDDQKDTWHWMGLSLSVAHTIGVHRNPLNSNMDDSHKKLWKRIWWSCYMRDRLIALGMRRSTRIKDDDYDVPMLELEDFETTPLSPELVRMLGGCPAVRDGSKRQALAVMCIELAKLCLCLSHVLSSQYSVLSHRFGGTKETTMMLLPKKCAAQLEDVMACDRELDQWYRNLPSGTHYFLPNSQERTRRNDGEVINLHRALLHMVYSTTVSALHRPQVLPSSPELVISVEVQEASRRKVRQAAIEITEIASDLYAQDQVKYLPTSGVTVLLPAIIIHLLDIKSTDPATRTASMRRFYQCMQVLQRLREIYASADSAFSFLEAAVRKANIEMQPPPLVPRDPYLKLERPTSGVFRGLAMPHEALTPPPDATQAANTFLFLSTLAPPERHLFTAVSPPQSDRSLNDILTGGAVVALDDLHNDHGMLDFSKNDFDALINFDAGADLFAAEDGLGVDLDMDWMAGLPGDGSNLVEANNEGFSLASKEHYGITGDLDRDLGMVHDD